MNGNSSLFTSLSWPKAKTPKRAEVLNFMNSVLPWPRLEEIAKRVHVEKRATGRPGYPTKMMVRVAVLQMIYRLSDEGTESLILDSHAAAHFAGLDPWRPRPPGASAIRNFRNLLRREMLLEEIQIEIFAALNLAGAFFQPGAIIEPVIRRRGK